MEGNRALPRRLQEAQIGTADLKIAGPSKPSQTFVGGSGQVAFSLKYAGHASAVPTFALSATTTAKGGKAKTASASFTPAGPRRGSPDAGKVTVSVPRRSKPGTYQVTLTAQTPQGGVATGVGKLKVTKPKLKFGGVKLNTGKGTATLKVKVPSGGQADDLRQGRQEGQEEGEEGEDAEGQDRAPAATRAPSSAASGSVKVKVKATFKPSSGISVSKTKSIVLKLR